jgi:hypothetical protein
MMNHTGVYMMRIIGLPTFLLLAAMPPPGWSDQLGNWLQGDHSHV